MSSNSTKKRKSTDSPQEVCEAKERRKTRKKNHFKCQIIQWFFFGGKGHRIIQKVAQAFSMDYRIKEIKSNMIKIAGNISSIDLEYGTSSLQHAKEKEHILVFPVEDRLGNNCVWLQVNISLFLLLKIVLVTILYSIWLQVLLTTFSPIPKLGEFGDNVQLQNHMKYLLEFELFTLGSPYSRVGHN